MKAKKILAVILAAVMCLAIFASCGKTEPKEEESTEATSEASSSVQAQGSDYEKLKAKGKMVVGITLFEPIDYKDENGEITGFDAEFARATAAKLGLDVEFIVIDWDSKFSELKSGTIDCVWNGMTITDEVNLNSSCTIPYVQNKQVVVMAKDKLDKYTTVDAMKDLVFAVESGSAGESVAKEAGLTTTAVQDQAATLMEVESGTSDAAVVDLTLANNMIGEGTSYADLGIGIVLNNEQYGVAFRQGSDMTAKVNDIFVELAKDGTLPKLAEKYGLTLDEGLTK